MIRDGARRYGGDFVFCSIVRDFYFPQCLSGGWTSLLLLLLYRLFCFLGSFSKRRCRSSPHLDKEGTKWAENKTARNEAETPTPCYVVVTRNLSSFFAFGVGRNIVTAPQ